MNNKPKIPQNKNVPLKCFFPFKEMNAVIMETRPLSREKRWRVVTILEKAK